MVGNPYSYLMQKLHNMAACMQVYFRYKMSNNDEYFYDSTAFKFNRVKSDYVMRCLNGMSKNSLYDICVGPQPSHLHCLTVTRK